MNQKRCRSCPHLDFNDMTDEMYCKLKDFEQIRLRWHKHRPDWCPLLKGAEGGNNERSNSVCGRGNCNGGGMVYQ